MIDHVSCGRRSKLQILIGGEETVICHKFYSFEGYWRMVQSVPDLKDRTFVQSAGAKPDCFGKISL